MVEIALTQGKVALIDDQDLDRVALFNWFASTMPRMQEQASARPEL